MKNNLIILIIVLVISISCGNSSSPNTEANSEELNTFSLIVSKTDPMLKSSNAIEITKDYLFRTSDNIIIINSQFMSIKLEIENAYNQIIISDNTLSSIYHPMANYSHYLRLTLEQTGYDPINTVLNASGNTTVNFETGLSEFDNLNSKYGLISTTSSSYQYSHMDEPNSSCLLYFPHNININKLAKSYESLEYIKYASPIALIGNSSSIIASKYNDNYYFIFKIGWGDCPSGCIYNKYYYASYNGTVSFHTESEAKSLIGFSSIITP
jgi:hypothetical protein